MKRYVITLILILACASAFGFTYTQLLSEEDREFQHIDNANGRALGSESRSEHPWESYNRWQCFDISQVELTCADYDKGNLVPSIKAVTQSEIFLFDTHVEDRQDCKKTLSTWRQLLVGGSEICIFAANMPDVDLGSDGGRAQSLWYISRLKGAGGYWNLFEESSEEH